MRARAGAARRLRACAAGCGFLSQRAAPVVSAPTSEESEELKMWWGFGRGFDEPASLSRMVVAYIRVSSKSQDLRMQRDAITRAANLRGHPVQRWYAEKTSGVGARPELSRLREDARGGRVSLIYVYRLDRLCRGGILEVFNLVHEFRAHGCKLETIGDGFSLDGPAGDVILAVFAWVAEMERNTIRERTAVARAAVEAAGGHWGRPKKTDEHTRERIRKMAETKTVRQIAVALKIPKSTVGEVLTSNKR